MCLPLCVLKFYGVFAGLVHVGIGIGTIVIGGILINDNDSLFPDEVKNYKDSAYLGFIILGCIIILSGIFGIIGSIKKLKCLLGIFSFFTFWFLLIFVALLVLCIVGKQYIDDNLGEGSDCRNSKIKELVNADSVFAQADSYFCNVTVCQCKVTRIDRWTNSTQRTLLTNGQNKTGGGPNNIMDCQNYPPTKPVLINGVDASTIQKYAQQFVKIDQNQLNSISSLMKALETTFGCTGICTGSYKYLFSDVDRGPTTSMNGCYTDLRNFIDNLITNSQIIAIVGTVLFFLNLVLSCCLICHPKKKDFYDNNESNNTQNNNVSNDNSSVKKLEQPMVVNMNKYL